PALGRTRSRSAYSLKSWTLEVLTLLRAGLLICSLLRKSSTNEKWFPKDYQVEAKFRHTIDHIYRCHDKTKIKDAIVARFEDGDDAPCVGYMRRGQLHKGNVYHHPEGA
ncbi:hypothetical protein Tco_1263480, partial [Tanacetum coccineum]